HWPARPPTLPRSEQSSKHTPCAVTEVEKAPHRECPTHQPTDNGKLFAAAATALGVCLLLFGSQYRPHLKNSRSDSPLPACVAGSLRKSLALAALACAPRTPPTCLPSLEIRPGFQIWYVQMNVY